MREWAGGESVYGYSPCESDFEGDCLPVFLVSSLFVIFLLSVPMSKTLRGITDTF